MKTLTTTGVTNRTKKIVFALALLCLALSVPAFADLYNNGPTLGNTNSYFIDVYSVSDSFVSNASGNITSFDVALWTPTGATPLTVNWAIGTSSLGSDVGSGGGPWSDVSLLCSNGSGFNGGACGGGFGYDVYDAHMNVGSLPVTGGDTYWLTPTGATDSVGGRDGWDVNAGASMAFHNLLGLVPSESFTINGGGTTTGTTPEPSSMMLFGSGALGLTTAVRRRRLRD
jgi:hypothetical protein